MIRTVYDLVACCLLTALAIGALVSLIGALAPYAQDDETRGG